VSKSLQGRNWGEPPAVLPPERRLSCDGREGRSRGELMIQTPRASKSQSIRARFTG
jgi:hypothetical protein